MNNQPVSELKMLKLLSNVLAECQECNREFVEVAGIIVMRAYNLGCEHTKAHLEEETLPKAFTGHAIPVFNPVRKKKLRKLKIKKWYFKGK